MINFHCSACGSGICVEPYRGGTQVTCPACQATCTAPNPTGTPQGAAAIGPPPVPPAVVRRGSRPPMPWTIKVALVLLGLNYVVSIGFTVVYLFGRQGSMEQMQRMSQQMMPFTLVSSLLGIAVILGLVYACLGYAWGAKLFAAGSLLGLPLGVLMLVQMEMSGFWPIQLTSGCLTLGMIALLLCSTSRDYYERAEKVRTSY